MNETIQSEGSSTLKRRVGRLEKLLELNAFINQSLDIDSVLYQILGSAAEVMDARASSIMLHDEATGDLLLQQATGRVREQVRKVFRIPKGKGIAGWVAERRQPLVIEDAYQDDRFSPSMDKKTGFRTKSILCVPLIAKERLVGVAQVINKTAGGDDTEEVGVFDAEDLKLFTLFADIAAIAISWTNNNHPNDMFWKRPRSGLPISLRSRKNKRKFWKNYCKQIKKICLAKSWS